MKTVATNIDAWAFIHFFGISPFLSFLFHIFQEITRQLRELKSFHANLTTRP